MQSGGVLGKSNAVYKHDQAKSPYSILTNSSLIKSIPVAVSISYGYLKGRNEKANGHLVVCIGFDEKGNIVVNDPGRSQVRQVYLRENLIKAWAESENTVYIVHPEGAKVPKDRFGHWQQ